MVTVCTEHNSTCTIHVYMKVCTKYSGRTCQETHLLTTAW